MWVTRHTVTVTSNGVGFGVAYTTEPVNGRLLAMRYVRTDFSDTLEIQVCTAISNREIVYVGEGDAVTSGTFIHRDFLHDLSGAKAHYVGGNKPVCGIVAIDNERLRVSVTCAGANKTGTFHLMVG